MTIEFGKDNDLIQRAVVEHAFRFGFKEDQLGFFIYCLQSALNRGRRHTADDIGEQLGPFVADMFRLSDRFLAPDQPSEKGRQEKREAEKRLEEDWPPFAFKSS